MRQPNLRYGNLSVLITPYDSCRMVRFMKGVVLSVTVFSHLAIAVFFLEVS